MIVYTVEQHAAQMEGPEGQVGIFATRAAAEKHRDDLLRLDPNAFADRGEADQHGTLDGYVLEIYEVQVAEQAPELVGSYDVTISTAQDIRDLYRGGSFFDGRQPTEEDIENLISFHRPLWHVEVDSADKIETIDGVQIQDHGMYYTVRGNDLVQVQRSVDSLQDLVRQIISEELLPTTFGSIDDVMAQLESITGVTKKQ